MGNAEESSLRQQLIDAREKMIVQLDKMYSPAYSGGAAGPPDFRDQIAELESELREINALLKGSDVDP